MTMTTCRRAMKLTAAALVLTLWPASAAPARADMIDKLLMKEAATVVKELQAHKCGSVGVFKFQVQTGKGEPTFLAGRLNAVMATRLENAIILAVDRAAPINVTRGASEAAAKRDKSATYRTAEGRSKLFAGRYPRAWGEGDIDIQAIVSGVVKLSDDLTSAEVELHLYLPKDKEAKKLGGFSVPTNRLLLADMGRGFNVAKRDLTADLPLDVLDRAAVTAVSAPAPKTLDDGFDGLIDFEAFYDGKKAKRGADLTLEGPKQGQEVHFTLKAKERLGVVLLVNGVNTLNEESDEREADQYSMWVLEPGREYVIRGYYAPDKGGKSGLKDFKVLAESESVIVELDNPKRGKVELLLFREAPKASPDKLPKMALRPLSLREVPAGKTLDEVRGSIRRASTARRVRGLLTPDTARQPAPEIQKVSFEGVLAGYRAVTYYQSK